MEFESAFTGAMATMLGWLVAGILLAKMITPVERRLVAGTALLLAGLFLLSRPELGMSVTVASAGTWMLGLGIFTRASLDWRGEMASRAGPLAAILVLPGAFLGSILLVGVVVSAAAAPVRLVLRIAGV